ncbi:MAG: hypothetical protein ACM3MD_02765 [Betaproteobacteria bacterium]
MDRELYDKINEEVEGYRKALVHYAKTCEWDTFEKKAGTLFDYLESIELTVLEQKFFKVFWIILVVLIGAVAVILKADSLVFPPLVKYKDPIVLLAIAASCFELYFFLDFRIYVEAKMSRYKKRREQFIRNIESDFKALFCAPMNGREKWSHQRAA